MGVELFVQLFYVLLHINSKVNKIQIKLLLYINKLWESNKINPIKFVMKL